MAYIKIEAFRCEDGSLVDNEAAAIRVSIAKLLGIPVTGDGCSLVFEIARQAAPLIPLLQGMAILNSAKDADERRKSKTEGSPPAADPPFPKAVNRVLAPGYVRPPCEIGSPREKGIIAAETDYERADGQCSNSEYTMDSPNAVEWQRGYNRTVEAIGHERFYS